eukprot:21087-Pelagomonas_calceolata.AAC.1
MAPGAGPRRRSGPGSGAVEKEFRGRVSQHGSVYNSVLASQARLALIGNRGAHAGMLESMHRA